MIVRGPDAGPPMPIEYATSMVDVRVMEEHFAVNVTSEGPVAAATTAAREPGPLPLQFVTVGAAVAPALWTANTSPEAKPKLAINVASPTRNGASARSRR